MRRIRGLPERKTPAQSTAPAPKAPSPFALPTPATTTAPTFPFPQPTVAPTAAIENYYKSLRALNLALLDSLQHKVTEDVFVDLAPHVAALTKQYSSYRQDLEKDYRSQFTVKPATPAPAAVPTPSFPKFTVVAPVVPAPPKTGMPVPPAKFSFGSGEPIKSTTPSTAPGFIPTGTALKKGDSDAFKFPEKAVVPGVEAHKEKAKFSPVAPSPLRFGASPPVVQKIEEPTKSAFSFGSSYAGIIADPKPTVAPALSLPAFGVPAPPAAPSTPTTSTPTSAFNAPPSTIPSSLSTAKTLPPAFVPSVAIPISAAIPSFSFGTPSASPPLTTAFGAGSSPTASAFAFGAGLRKDVKSSPGAGLSAGFSFGASKATGAAFSFGGSTATPVQSTTGFSFGSSPTSAVPKEETTSTAALGGSNSFGAANVGTTFGATTTKPFGFPTPASATTLGGSATGIATPAAATTGFSFGGSPASTPSIPTPPVVVAAGEEEQQEEQQDGSSEMVSSAKPVSGGEGEEGELILHHARGKVWTIVDGISNELGVAGIWIKERDGVRRLLARNEVTGNVLIVRRPFSPLSLESTPRVRQGDSSLLSYKIRCVLESSYHRLTIFDDRTFD